MHTWHGRTSLHLVLPVWHAVHARRTDGAFATDKGELFIAVEDDDGPSRFLLPSLALAEAFVWSPCWVGSAELWVVANCWVSMEAEPVSWAGVLPSLRADIVLVCGKGPELFPRCSPPDSACVAQWQRHWTRRKRCAVQPSPSYHHVALSRPLLGL